MINITEQDKLKLQLIDILFQRLDVEELKKSVDLEMNVSKLKGETVGNGIISQLLVDYSNTSLQIINLQTQLYDMKSDIQNLTKILNQSVFLQPYVPEWNSLKSKYNVY